MVVSTELFYFSDRKIMKMKRLLSFVAVFLVLLFSANAQDFEYKIPVKVTKGTVKVLGEDLVVIDASADGSKRFVARNLPEEYKKNELPVNFSGLEAPIPPYIRMAGRPLHLLCIKVSKADQKKLSLSKAKYTFKKP
jgi:hypothetical protein